MLLKQGDHNTNVAIWQGFLNAQGFKYVVADANFGPNTEKATKEFQAMCVLPMDGKVGPNTIAQAVHRGFKGFPSEPATETPKPGKLILISAGHTNVQGQDQGAAGNGCVEGKEAVKIRDRVAGLLRATGLSVVEDGADGVSEPLKKAIVLAKKADIAVEFHFNAGPAVATGVEVLSKSEKAPLAKKLAGAVATALGLPLRGSGGGWKSDSSGQHHRLGFCEAGGLIVEVCFITSASDMKSYITNFDAMCKAVAEVLANA